MASAPSSGASRKRSREDAPAPAPAPVEDDPFGPGGLYDFLPAPDPEKDAAAKAAAAVVARPALPPEDRSRVIFLDVDGVLLAAGSVETIYIEGAFLPVRATITETDFNKSALVHLRAIVVQTGASIVLSSEWRRTSSLRDSIGAVLRSHDIPNIRDATPILQARAELQKLDPAIVWCERRAREIGKWLKEHPEVSAWVALDDLNFSWADSERLAGTPIVKPRSVLTDAKLCITEEDAAEAVRILLSPLAEPKV